VAVSHVSTSTDTRTGSETDITITKPASLQDGDVLLATLYTGGGSDNRELTSAPSGFVKVSSHRSGAWGHHAHVYYKVVTTASGEPSTYTFTHGATSGCLGGGLTAWRGVNNDNPINTFNVDAGWNFSEPYTTPPVTVTAPSKVLHYRTTTDETQPVPFTFTASATELYDLGSPNSANTISYSSALYEITGDQPAGVVNGLAITCSGTELAGTSHTIALEAGEAAGTGSAEAVTAAGTVNAPAASMTFSVGNPAGTATSNSPVPGVGAQAVAYVRDA
jgi:hypothetical protein